MWIRRQGGGKERDTEAKKQWERQAERWENTDAVGETRDTCRPIKKGLRTGKSRESTARYTWPHSAPWRGMDRSERDI